MSVTSFTWNGTTTTVAAGSFATATSNGASLTVNSDGGFEYTPATNSVADDSFTYTLSNGTTTTAAATAYLSIAAAQPSFTAPAGLSITSGDNLDIGGLSLSDPNAGSDVNVTFSADNGTINLSTSLLTGGSWSGNDSGQVYVTASLAEIDSMLANPSNVVYTTASTFMDEDTLTVTENSFSSGGSSDSVSVPITMPPTVSSFSVSQVNTYVLEKTGEAVVTINRSGSLAGTATVQYATSSGTASSPSNYTAVAGTLTFSPGEVSTTVIVPLTTSGTLTAGQGSFSVNLSTPSGDNTISADNAQIDLIANEETPVAVPDLYTMVQNTTLSAGPGQPQPGLLANDFDPLDDVLSVTGINGSDYTPGTPITTTKNGGVTVEPDGSFSYTPSLSFSGVDSWTYTVSTPSGATALATVQVDVVPLPPVITGLPGPLTVAEQQLASARPLPTSAASRSATPMPGPAGRSTWCCWSEKVRWPCRLRLG